MVLTAVGNSFGHGHMVLHLQLILQTFCGCHMIPLVCLYMSLLTSCLLGVSQTRLPARSPRYLEKIILGIVDIGVCTYLRAYFFDNNEEFGQKGILGQPLSDASC